MQPIICAVLALLNQAAASVIVQSSLSAYQNGWDKELLYDAGENRMLTGLFSYHDNGKEDRRWRFWAGSVPGVLCADRQWTSWVNDWDKPLSFNCGGQQALSGIWSFHDNGKEDRRWKFRCCDISKNVEGVRFRKTDYLNDWDDVLDFRCGASEALHGLESYHDNGREDRLWKATCIALGNSDVALLRQVGWTGYINKWDGSFTHELGANSLYSGIYSIHSNKKEDRLFQIHRVDLSNGLKCTNPRWSNWQNDMDGVLNYKCGGNYGICGLKSYHRNRQEDRRFNIKCCDVSNNGDYAISTVYQTGYVNEYDGKINFKCGYMEVLVGLFSQHNNKKEDRRFKLYCGRIAPTNNLQAVKRNSVQWTDYRNEWDGALEFIAPGNSFIVGLASYHDNHKEDRRWRLGTAALDGAICEENGWSAAANGYDDTMDYLCPGNHALAGVKSSHNNHYEDRIWKFKCCDLSKSGIYQLRSPLLSSQQNNWDGRLFYECAQDSVISGAYSVHSNKKEDRQWQFYCSQVVKISSYFQEVSDVVVSTKCPVVQSEVVDKKTASVSTDGTNAVGDSMMEIEDCLELSFENQVQWSESTCKSETSEHTKSYTSSVGHEWSLTASVTAGKFGVEASLETSYSLALEDSKTTEDTTVNGEEQCSENTEVSTTSTTMSNCKICSTAVTPGSCVVLRKVVTYRKITARCEDFRELSATNIDGSKAEYKDLLIFFKEIGMTSSPYKVGPHTLGYSTEVVMEVAHDHHADCIIDKCGGVGKL